MSTETATVAAAARLPWLLFAKNESGEMLAPLPFVINDKITLLSTTEPGKAARITIAVKAPAHGIQTVPGDDGVFVRATVLGKDRSWNLENVSVVDRDTVAFTFETLKEFARVMPFPDEVEAWLAKNPKIVTEARDRSILAWREYRAAQAEAVDAALTQRAADIVRGILDNYTAKARESVHYADRLAALDLEVSETVKLDMIDAMDEIAARLPAMIDAADDSDKNTIASRVMEALKRAAE